jgi:hypothetical protein
MPIFCQNHSVPVSNHGAGYDHFLFSLHAVNIQTCSQVSVSIIIKPVEMYNTCVHALIVKVTLYLTFQMYLWQTVEYMIRHMNPVIQIIVDTLVKNTEPLFVTKTVSQLMFEGYEDELLNITSMLNVSDFKVPFDKFGWYYPVCIKHCVNVK